MDEATERMSVLERLDDVEKLANWCAWAVIAFGALYMIDRLFAEHDEHAHNG